MAQTHAVKKLYVTQMRYLTTIGMPLIERGWTAEIEEPWRIGSCVVIRIPWTKIGIVLGWWGAPGIEVDTLTLATGYRQIDGQEDGDADLVA